MFKMPPRKKSSAEQLSEYIPFSPENSMHTIEIPVKEKPGIDEIEKIEQIGTKKEKRKIKSKEKTEIIKKEKPRGKGTILIITEKPQAALKIAYALGNPAKQSKQGVPYYELERQGKRIIVACAVGHLFTLSQSEKDSSWPVFNISWQANWQVKKNDWSKKYYSVLSSLCKEADSFIVATDYDIEGEVIGLNIVRFIAKQEDAKRMKFSSLTKDEIEQAYENTKESLDWGQAIAGETRHYLDWFYGINLSRAIMGAIKKAGNFRIMSIGRVQGPALHLVVEKERKILAFKPEPYWQVFVLIDNTILKYFQDITKKQELEKFKNLQGEIGEAKTTKTLEKIPPFAPFDLTTLQLEAYKFFKINPSRTLQIAQQLYLAGLISYPRTSSQKIPEAINYKKILSKLDKSLTKFIARDKPIEGRKSDPAHPSIYPTGERQELFGEDKKIYELIVKRFIACFCKDALVENKKIEFILKLNDKEELKFITRGLEIKEKGWLNVYPARLAEKELRDLNGSYKIERLNIEEKMTQPPKRYTPASLVSELEKRNLGTKSTRASIIETLYDRGYIKEQQIEATPLGMSLISTLEKHSPIIIDEALTRKFEKEMDSIQTAKKNLNEKEEIEIGQELINATNNLREQEREATKLMPCQKCKKGSLVIKYSPKFKRSFIACNSYPECKTTFPLPPGFIKKTEKICDKCSFPLLLRISKGKRPWFFCFNPACESRKNTSTQDTSTQENN